MAGGGCTLPGNATVLMPGEGYEGVTKFVLDRMTSYVKQACPKSEEMLVDEALSICAEIDAWRERKTSMEAQARYNALLFHGILGQGGDEDE